MLGIFGILKKITPFIFAFSFDCLLHCKCICNDTRSLDQLTRQQNLRGKFNDFIFIPYVPIHEYSGNIVVVHSAQATELLILLWKVGRMWYFLKISNTESIWLPNCTVFKSFLSLSFSNDRQTRLLKICLSCLYCTLSWL